MSNAFKFWFWAEWNLRVCKKRWWQFRVWDDPSRDRCLMVFVGLHWIVQLAAWAVHRWQKAQRAESWLERKLKQQQSDQSLSEYRKPTA